MADQKDSPDWLNDLARVTAQQDKTPDASQGELARTLKLHRPYVSNLLGIAPIFDPPTVKKVRDATPDYTLSYRSAILLVGLKGKVADYPMAGREAVEEIIARGLVTNQVKGLVDQMAVSQHATGRKAASGDESTPGFYQSIGRRIDEAIAGSAKSALVIAVCLLLLAYGIFWVVTHSGQVLDWVHSNPPSAQTTPTTVAAQPAQAKPPIQHSPKVVKRSGSAAKGSTPKPAITAYSAFPVTLSAAQVADAAFVTTFAHDLYNVTHRNIEERRDSLQSMVSDDFAKDFTDDFFNGDRLDNFQRFNVVETFTLLQPVKMTLTDGKTEDFYVKGTVVSRSEDDNSKSQTQAVAVLVTIAHDAGGEPKVVDLTTVNTK